MKFIVVIILLTIGHCICDEVENYVEAINEFINETNDYEYPTSNRVLQSNDKVCSDGGTYDYIIVGAGTTGSLVANRLSANPNLNILVLEFGGNDSNITDIPAMFDYLRMSEFNWGYSSTSQSNSLKGYINNSIPTPRGKVIGGSSTINAVMYVRGNMKDFDQIASLTSSSIWSSKNILKYFKMSEKALNFSPQVPAYHGYTGELKVSQTKVLTTLSDAFIRATNSLGSTTVDYNADNQIGVSLIQSMVENGKRNSAAKAFLKPALTRNNLKLILNALVTRVLLNKDTATGVEYVANKKTYCAKVTKDVILSAGSINSPQLLMLSGIGPKRHLQRMKIKVQRNLPVGSNMWDHVAFAALPVVTNLTLQPTTLQEDVTNYLNGNGRLTVPDAVQAVNFVSHSGPKDLPDIEHIFRASYVPTMPYDYYYQTKNFNQETYQCLIKPLEGYVSWNSIVMLLHPLSRGSVTLKSNSPYDFPNINTNYFSDKKNMDVKTLTKGIRDMLSIVNTDAMQAYGSKVMYVKNAACKNYPVDSDRYMECLIRYYASTIHHFGGTCKMGKWRDSAVVNERLLVYGYKNLRVADVSVIPIPTSGHTTAVAYVVGEVLSAILLNKI